jgi:hypothetical protein
VVPVYTPNLWSLNIPPRIHFFLWLLFKNKILTTDNLAKRQVENKMCPFCDELESSQHISSLIGSGKKDVGDYF